ncbi:DUF3303 domain-containing protein [Saccharospirillum sp.]|uniref:DUF3303 domain-containing protein n=1 Tax=Saccharospirillum sp. TaxID=2033801 RepID=UPI00349FE444
MLHMVIARHSPESCPGRQGNESVHLCLNSMEELIQQRGVKIVGRWADPPAHVNYMVLDAENAHVIQELFMESGLFESMEVDVRPVLSMD